MTTPSPQPHDTAPRSEGPQGGLPTSGAGSGWQPAGSIAPAPPTGASVPISSARPPRHWLIAAPIAVVVAGVALALVLAFGGANHIGGQPVATAAGAGPNSTGVGPNSTGVGPDAQAVVTKFLALESARYSLISAPPPAPIPDPIPSDYAEVSCAKDLNQMPPGTPGAARPKPQASYRLTLKSIKPTSGNRQLVEATITNLNTGKTAPSFYYLQRENNAWRICGLYSNTWPVENDIAAAQAVAVAFVNAINNGDNNTAAAMACASNPGVPQEITQLIANHAHLEVKSVNILPNGEANAVTTETAAGPIPSHTGVGLDIAPNGSWCVGLLAG